MKKNSTKLISLLMALAMLFTCGASQLAVAYACDCDICPAIVIPGVFQSDVRYYDDAGNEMLNADGEPYSGPFFLDTTPEIVKSALENALLPIGGMLATQRAKDEKAAQAIAEVLGETLAGKVRSDQYGNVIGNVRAVKYETSLANLSEYDRNYALNQIPLQEYVKIAGLDHLYFFSYMSFDNIQRLAEELYQLIQTAKEETGHDKVNLIPISQGGSLENALMQLYKDKGLDFSEDVNRVVYIIPAADGTAILGDIYEYGLLDDDGALYGYMFPSLLGDDQQWLAYLITLLLRIMPNAQVNKIIDRAVDILVDDYLAYSTCMWALIPSGNYPGAAEKYLSQPGDEFIREQTDWYYRAQVDSRANILDLKDKGVEFFDIVDYNCSLYQICDSWNKTNADGVIHLDSTSFGATAAVVGETLPDDYVQQNTYCTDPSHNHIDEERIVDASTGILPETSFYFKGQNHEQTARNDVIMRLAIRILTDSSFADIYSDPGYPQFNYARDSRGFINLYNQWKNYDTSGLNEADKAELEAALAEAKIATESTCMPTEEYNASKMRLENITYKIANGEERQEKQLSAFNKLFTRIFRFFSEIMLKYFGGKGYSDIVLLRGTESSPGLW